jgi:hypothetical protein
MHFWHGVTSTENIGGKKHTLPCTVTQAVEGRDINITVETKYMDGLELHLHRNCPLYCPSSLPE